MTGSDILHTYPSIQATRMPRSRILLRCRVVVVQSRHLLGCRAVVVQSIIQIKSTTLRDYLLNNSQVPPNVIPLCKVKADFN